MKTSRTVWLLALASVSGAVMAAGTSAAIPAPAVFVSKAAQDGMTEVEVGKLALGKSHDPKIRDFAQRMVKDHGKANDELAAIAKTRGIDAPTKLDADHQAMVDSFRDKSGAEFDASYAQHMNMGHTEALALFEGATKTGDAALAGFAKKTLPTLKEHKRMAEKLPGNR